MDQVIRAMAMALKVFPVDMRTILSSQQGIFGSQSDPAVLYLAPIPAFGQPRARQGNRFL